MKRGSVVRARKPTPRRASSLEVLMLSHLALAKVERPEVEHRFHPTRHWRFDLAWPARKLAVEIEGGIWKRGRHSRGAGFEADCVKYAHAVILGWRVIRVTGGMVRDGRALAIVEQVMRGEAA
jgi:hypothetical protein